MGDGGGGKMRIQNRAGMTLVEVLVYLGMLSMISLASMTLVHWYHRFLGPTMGATVLMLETHLAQDVFARDVRRAPARPHLWQVREPQMLVWSLGEIDIGWEYKRKKLYRMAGRYHADRNKWSNVSRSKILGKCEKVHFAVHEFSSTGILRGVTAEIATSKQSVEQFTAIREGITG